MFNFKSLLSILGAVPPRPPARVSAFPSAPLPQKSSYASVYLEAHVCIHLCESGEVTKLNLSVKKTDFIPRTRRRVQLRAFYVHVFYVCT